MENKSRAYPNGLDPYRNKVNDNVRNNNFNYINNASQDFTKQTMDNQAKNFNSSLNHVNTNNVSTNKAFTSDNNLNNSIRNNLNNTNASSNLNNNLQHSNSNLKHDANTFNYDNPSNSYINTSGTYNDYDDVNFDDARTSYTNNNAKAYNDVNYNNYQGEYNNSNSQYANGEYITGEYYDNNFVSDEYADKELLDNEFDDDGYYNDDEFMEDNFDGSFDDSFDDATSTEKGSRLYKKKKYIFIAEFVGLIFIGIGIYIARIFAGVGDVTGQGGLSDDDVALKTKTGHVTIALLGSDAEDESGVRSDTIIIADINQDNGDIKLVSVARDFFAYVPGYKEAINKRVGRNAQGSDFTKINHSFNMGPDIHTASPTDTVKALDTNFCLGIKDFITVNFASMADLIELTGGVDVSFADKDTHFVFYVNKFGEEAANTAGQDYEDVPDEAAGQSKVHLNGYQALGYCRVRKQTEGHPEHPLKNESDFTRSERQKEVIGLILENVKKKGATKLPEIADVFKKKKNFQTSYDMKELLELATDAVKNGYHISNDEKLSLPIEPYEVNVSKSSTQFSKTCLYEDARALHHYLYGDDKVDIKHFEDVMKINDQLEDLEKQYSPTAILKYCFDQNGNYNEEVTNWVPNNQNPNNQDQNNQDPNNQNNANNTNQVDQAAQTSNTSTKKKNNWFFGGLKCLDYGQKYLKTINYYKTL